VNDVGPRITDQAPHAPEHQGERAERVEGDLGEIGSHPGELGGEPGVAWAGHRDVELACRKMSHEIEDLPRAAAERGAGQELQDANHATLLSPPILTFAVSRAADQSREAGAQNVVDVRAPTVDHPSNSR